MLQKKRRDLCRFLKPSVRGFTLIELIVVMVILGVLAAVAMPKFVDMRRQARIAAIRGMEGGIRSAITLTQAAYYLQRPPPLGERTVKPNTVIDYRNISLIRLADGTQITVGNGAASKYNQYKSQNVGSPMLEGDTRDAPEYLPENTGGVLRMMGFGPVKMVSSCTVVANCTYPSPTGFSYAQLQDPIHQRVVIFLGNERCSVTYYSLYRESQQIVTNITGC